MKYFFDQFLFFLLKSKVTTSNKSSRGETTSDTQLNTFIAFFLKDIDDRLNDIHRVVGCRPYIVRRVDDYCMFFVS